MDDDDIVHPHRFRKSVEALKENTDYHLVGCSAVLVYNLRTKMLMRAKEISQCHTLEPMTGFTREYATYNRFDNTDPRGLLAPFLGAKPLVKWSTPILQMKADDICVIIGHDENTFDKYQVECYSDRFGIVEKNERSLAEIYDMFRTSPEIQYLFEKAYDLDISKQSHTLKRKTMLKNLDTQYKLESNKDDYDEFKRIKSYEYKLFKKFIKENNLNKYECLQQLMTVARASEVMYH